MNTRFMHSFRPMIDSYNIAEPRKSSNDEVNTVYCLSIQKTQLALVGCSIFSGNITDISLRP